MDGTDQSNSKARFMVYSRYFARIPKYINKALKIVRKIKKVNTYGTSIQMVFPIMEKPLFALGILSMFHDVYFEYCKISHKNRKYRYLFMADQAVWHTFGSFIFPGIFISKSIEIFVLFSQKYIKNSNYLKCLSVGFSIVLIACSIKFLDNLTDVFLDNTYRKIIDYRGFDEEKVKILS
jgi:hypothetical protein